MLTTHFHHLGFDGCVPIFERREDGLASASPGRGSSKPPRKREELNEPPDKPSKSRIEVERCGTAWLITLHGEHDISTQSLLRRHVDRVREPGGPIVVDLSRATFLDSTVISALVVAWHESGGDFVLVAPRHYQGTRLVELIGIGTVIPVYPTRAAAIAALVE